MSRTTRGVLVEEAPGRCILRNYGGMETWLIVWYGLSSFILGLLLFFPLRKFILSMSINRHQRRTQEAASDEVLEKLKQKVYLIAAIISMTFAFFYTRVVIMKWFE